MRVQYRTGVKPSQLLRDTIVLYPNMPIPELMRLLRAAASLESIRPSCAYD